MVQMTRDEDEITQGSGAKCHTNLDQNDKRWDRNDGPKLSGVRNGLSVFR